MTLMDPKTLSTYPLGVHGPPANNLVSVPGELYSILQQNSNFEHRIYAEAVTFGGC